jgi:deazaflavin-dependent oxidoreductase (nitroreductase family)
MSAFEERVGRVAVRWMTGANLAVYRLTGGRVAGRVPGGAPICLLTTTGRRSGRPRTVPLLALPRDDGRLVVVASHGGMSTQPAWYLNLLAEPRVTVETGSARRSMLARTATVEERTRLWPALTAVYPHFDAYQRRTTRPIPVVILDPAPGPARPHPG